MPDPAGRADRLIALLAERGLDSILVTDLTNVAYLCGFTGTNGACIVSTDPDARLFLTDFRYTERAASEVIGFDPVTVEGDWLGGIAERLDGRVGIEDDHLSLRQARHLEERVGEGVELIPAGGAVESLRRVKDDQEVKRIAAAAELADSVYRQTIDRGLAGHTEADVAGFAVERIRRLGGEPSFDPIVAGGPNGAQPHAEPGEREIGRGELVVFDMGAKLDGYCSDCTRTYSTGPLEREAAEAYEVVLAAQIAALGAVRPGMTGSEVDAVARDLISSAGYGENFGHGLGHGVGMEIHEGPRLGRRSGDVLAEGEVVTFEPGIYLPGRFGIRIEDLVVLGPEGVLHNLSPLPKELTEV